MEERDLQNVSSAENFTLQDFARSEGDTFQDRVKAFSDYLRESNARGYALYGREIQGPTGPTVQVQDSLTGTVREMIMMGSNNYLGLANHPKVKQSVKDAIDRYGVGMGGPPLLNGMSSLHRELEQRLATLKGKEDALLYPSGFQANLGWVTALIRPGDVILVDELHHASLFDGVRLAKTSQNVQARIFRHNDLEMLERLLVRANSKRAAGAQIFVAVEGVYSMDGDLVPLPEVVALCRRHEATLSLDDAHGTGILGQRGGGTAEHFGACAQIDLSMGTFSKVFGVTGGFVAGSRELVDYLRYFSRSYMFSAHLSQTIVATVLAGLKVMEEEPHLRASLQRNVDHMLTGLRGLGYSVHSDSAIIPILLPAGIEIRRLGKRLHEEGLFCNMIEAPAVSPDQQRIRLSLMANHEPEHLQRALEVFGKVGREFRLTETRLDH